MKIVGYLKDCENVKLPEEAIGAVKDFLEIISENYGEDRDLKTDLGGYAVVLESSEEVIELNSNLIKGVIPEDVEEIKCGDGQVYCSSLFILSCDYAVIVVATKELTDLLLTE